MTFTELESIAIVSTRPPSPSPPPSPSATAMIADSDSASYPPENTGETAARPKKMPELTLQTKTFSKARLPFYLPVPDFKKWAGVSSSSSSSSNSTTYSTFSLSSPAVVHVSSSGTAAAAVDASKDEDDARLEKLLSLRQRRRRTSSSSTSSSKRQSRRLFDALFSAAKFALFRWISFLVSLFRSSEKAHSSPCPSSSSSSSSASSSSSSSSSPSTQLLIEYASLLPPPSPTSALRLAALPRKTLILDLDETLVHSIHGAPGGGGRRPVHALPSPISVGVGFRFKVWIDARAVTFSVFQRPHVDRFLDVVARWYDLAVFTASLQSYGNAVAETLDAGRGILPVGRRFFRQHCDVVDGGFTKDVGRVEPDLKRVVIIDNSPAAYRRCADNAIPIASWFCHPDDTALLDLLPFLDALRFVDDVRSVLSCKKWNQ